MVFTLGLTLRVHDNLGCCNCYGRKFGGVQTKSTRENGGGFNAQSVRGNGGRSHTQGEGGKAGESHAHGKGGKAGAVSAPGNGGETGAFNTHTEGDVFGNGAGLIKKESSKNAVRPSENAVGRRIFERRSHQLPLQGHNLHDLISYEHRYLVDELQRGALSYASLRRAIAVLEQRTKAYQNHRRMVAEMVPKP